MVPLAATGNTFHVWDGLDGVVPGDPAREARERCAADGRDGFLVVRRDPVCTCRVEVYNRDGSCAETCGNGLRCVAAFAAERRLTHEDRLSIATDAGVARARVERVHGRVVAASVTMGPLPVVRPLELGLDLAGATAFAVDLANPHCVVIGDEALLARISELGPAIAGHPAFERGANVELVVATAPLRVRVWERGVGETRSCGSGACAVAAAAVYAGLVIWPVFVEMPGGRLYVGRADGELELTGPVG